MKALLPLALALVLAACGGSEESSVTTDNEPQATATESTSTTEQDDAGRGRDLFASTCSGCHTLAAADAEGAVGPNLDDLEPDADTVLNAIESGPGAMPDGLLQGEDAQAVADFVAESAGG